MADADGRPFAELRDAGLLWLFNRTALHPRGFALALHFDKDGNATGWSLKGDGTEPWAFAMDAEEDASFQRAEATLRDAPERTASRVSQHAEELHAEHHAGYIVPSLDSCPEHTRAEYEQLVRSL